MSLVSRFLLGIIRLYQWFVSPMLSYAFGPRCRFHPSCSCYASDALRIHGALRGTGLAAWRVLRCHPFSRGGLDPVPPVGEVALPEESARP